jgi:ERCC4-related helicase/ribosomal protein S27AE
MTSLDDLWSLMYLVDPRVLGTYQQFVEEYYVQELIPHPKVKWRHKTCPHCGCSLIYNNGWDVCSNNYCNAIEVKSTQGQKSTFVPYRIKVRSIWNTIDYINLDKLSRILQKYIYCYFPEQDIKYIEWLFDMSFNTDLEYYKIAKDLIEKEDAGEETPWATRLIELQYLIDRSKEKKEKLKECINSIEEKGCIIYTTFYESLNEIEEVLNNIKDIEYRTYTGEDNKGERNENKEWFIKNPKNKVLILSAAGGASLNLQVTNEFVFYNLSYGFGAMSQAMGRVIRLFSTFKEFHIHFILANNSVDIYKYKLFLMYQTIMQKLFNNKLINLEKPINFSTYTKNELRRELCWRTNG